MQKAKTGLLRILTAAFAALLISSAPLAAETVEGILIDKMCCSKIVPEKGYAGAKAHTRDCALMPQCLESGLGVITEAGKFYMLDEAGQKKAKAALQATGKKDNLTVSVNGQVEEGTIQVESLKLI